MRIGPARRARKIAMFRQQRGRCFWCRRQMSLTQGYGRSITEDHIVPIAAGDVVPYGGLMERGRLE